MPDRLFFDCNATFGQYPRKPALARWTLGHLLEDMDLAGIAGALVYNRQALHYDPMLGNRRLIEQIAPHRGRLFPCWVAMPSVVGEFPDAEPFVAELKQHDVRAVRFDLDQHRVPLKASLWRPLIDALRAANVLCVVSVNPYEANFDAYDRLFDLLAGLPTLMVNHGWGQWRQVAAMMNAHPHVHMEFSHFQANRAVEVFSQSFGTERCLFGTGLPDKAPGAARGFVDYGLFDDDTADMIAAGNLTRLLRGHGPTSPPARTQWDDAITDAVRARKSVPCVVLDAHCHIGDDAGTTLGGGVIAIDGGADGMIELTRRAGIDKTAIMSWAGPLSMDTKLGNETVARAVERYPGEFIGLSTINPDYDSPDDIRSIIAEYHIKRGFPGLKTFPACQSIKYDAPELHEWLQYGNDHKLYMVFDPSGEHDTARLEHLTRKYPDLSIHIDHCGQSWPYAIWAAEMCNRFPNVVAQLNYTLVTNGTIEYLVQHIGADRVLFGTDAPMRDPRPQVTWLVFTRLSEADKRMVFGGAFAKVLRRAGVEGV